jgi:hypothetical protein
MLTINADMVAAEEQKIDARKKAVAAQEAEDKKNKDKSSK